jgi:hypothetical protein
MTAGMLTVEVSRVVVELLAAVDPAVADRVWSRLRARLEADAATGGLLPPARVAELLRRWLLTEDPAGAVDRRKQAQRDGAGVDLWRTDHGLADIAIRGISGPNAQAIAQRIRDHAGPLGVDDQRTARERSRDAAVDLLLGRQILSFPAASVSTGNGGPCSGGSCGCGTGARARPLRRRRAGPCTARHRAGSERRAGGGRRSRSDRPRPAGAAPAGCAGHAPRVGGCDRHARRRRWHAMDAAPRQRAVRSSGAAGDGAGTTAAARRRRAGFPERSRSAA